MADKVGEEYDGFVTGVTAFGLFVQLVEHFVEGLVHVSTLADDYYRFVERVHAARREYATRVRLGDPFACRWCGSIWSGDRSTSASSSVLDAVRASERRPAAGQSPTKGGARPRAGAGPASGSGRSRKASGRYGGHDAPDRRHRRAHRPRQERARARR